MTSPADATTADSLVTEARRAVHESLTFLAAPEADRVRSLIADLETAVEGRTAIRMSAPVPSPPADRSAGEPRTQLLHALDFSTCLNAGYGEPEELLAAYDASRTPPSAGRIAEAALAAVEAALGDTLLPAAREEALAGIVAVLPPADRTPTIPPQADTAAGDESPHVYMDAVQDSAAWAHAFTKAGQMTEALEHVEAIERLLAVYRRAVGVEAKAITAIVDPTPLDVLRCLADPEPCRWEGVYCITHSWKSDVGRCPHGQAQALLGGGR
ncbi:hypothetical protein [Streptomyces sp. PU_AKi4]|uniref:hypothetical protein n=1 Tax=Streptomyces sp. PU_AKi4 TaxID=2800809 RepID=UPI003525C577